MGVLVCPSPIKHNRQQHSRILYALDRMGRAAFQIDPIADLQLGRTAFQSKLDMPFQTMKRDFARNLMLRDFNACVDDQAYRLELLRFCNGGGFSIGDGRTQLCKVKSLTGFCML